MFLFIGNRGVITPEVAGRKIVECLLADSFTYRGKFLWSDGSPVETVESEDSDVEMKSDSL